MSNEIKRGDKVRVSKDAPKMYLRGFDHIFTGVESVVSEVEDDNAVIIFNTDHINSQTTIPTKYLVKVDAEAKEAEFKVGDRVIDNENGRKGIVIKCYPNCYVVKLDDVELPVSYTEEALNPYIEPTAPKIKAGDRVRDIESGLIGIVDKIVYGNIVWVNGVDGKRYHWKSYGLELIEPAEQTEAEEGARIRQMEAELAEFRKAELDRMLHPEKYYTYEVTIDNVAMNWQRYEADLAKELAIVYGKRGKSPLDAVAAAKEITKRLKQK